MDDFIELIFELIIDGSIEALPNKKIPKILRIIIALIPISLLFGLLYLGILFLQNSTLLGVIIIIIAILLLLALIVKLINYMKE